MQLALGTRKGGWDEDRLSRGPHRKKRSQYINERRRGGRRSSSTSGHAQSSQSRTSSTHLGPWASTPHSCHLLPGEQQMKRTARLWEQPANVDGGQL